MVERKNGLVLPLDFKGVGKGGRYEIVFHGRWKHIYQYRVRPEDLDEKHTVEILRRILLVIYATDENVEVVSEPDEPKKVIAPPDNQSTFDLKAYLNCFPDNYVPSEEEWKSRTRKAAEWLEVREATFVQGDK